MSELLRALQAQRQARAQRAAAQEQAVRAAADLRDTLDAGPDGAARLEDDVVLPHLHGLVAVDADGPPLAAALLLRREVEFPWY